MQVEVNAAQAERQAHRKAAKKQARYENDQSASNLTSILSLAYVKTQPWAPLSSRSATLASRFAGAFLSVFRGVLVQLHCDDIRSLCLGTFAASGAKAPLAPMDFNAAAANPGSSRHSHFRLFALPIQGKCSLFTLSSPAGRTVRPYAKQRLAHLPAAVT